MSSMKNKINKDKLPQHIAIIMDGNGRWAQKRGVFRIIGHRAGAKSVRKVAEACAELGIKYLTLYAFSTENWNRPENEVNNLMELLIENLQKETKTLLKNDVSLNVIGDITRLPEKVQKNLNKTIEKTKQGKRMYLSLALSYSGRWDIIQACQNIAMKVKQKELNPEDIDLNMFAQYLSTKGMPDPELLIRTSGERRISNFMIYQMAYTEFYFTKTLWPDFSKNHLYRAIVDFQTRERRFGKTSAQL
ncbi:MAG: isoprenyl transferase [Bacteroidales bacterium]